MIAFDIFREVNNFYTVSSSTRIITIKGLPCVFSVLVLTCRAYGWRVVWHYLEQYIYWKVLYLMVLVNKVFIHYYSVSIYGAFYCLNWSGSPLYVFWVYIKIREEKYIKCSVQETASMFQADFYDERLILKSCGKKYCSSHLP